MTPPDTPEPDDSPSTPSSSPAHVSPQASNVVSRVASSLTSLRKAARARWNAPRLRPVRRTLSRLLDRYPPLSPAPEGIWPRVALGVIGVMALVFTIFFSAYLFARHDAYMTHAEDLGIMDQALWNTLHGAPLHQTICDRVTDNNCLGDISRLAIHFEPIMFPLSLLYLIAPSPKTLQFMLSRNNVGLIIACLLALSTKEEIPLDVALIGLSIVVLQRRARLGWGLVALAVVWLVAELAIMHLASPLGQSPTVARYSQF